MGGCIGDLLSFNLLLVDLVTGCFIGLVVVLLLFSSLYRFSSIGSVFGWMIPLCFLQDPLI